MFRKLMIEAGDVFKESGDPGNPGAGDSGDAGGGDGGKKADEFVSLEKFNTLEQTIGGLTDTISKLQGGMEVAMNNLKAGPLPAAVPEKKLTPFDLSKIKTAISEGDDSAADEILSLVNTVVKRGLDNFEDSKLKPLQETGLNAIADLSGAAIREKPHYEKYKDEINSYISSLPVESRVNPKAHDLAYDAVIGKHLNEIVDAAKEEALRSGSEDGGTGDPGNSGRGGKKNGDDEGKNVEEVFGKDAEEALSHIGLDQESFARKLGYESWDAYVKLANEQKVS